MWSSKLEGEGRVQKDRDRVRDRRDSEAGVIEAGVRCIIVAFP